MSTFQKWLPAVAMMLVSLISYIDRNTLALLAPTMLGELRLSGEQYGYVVSGFSVAYTVANLIWGRWIDRFGLPIAMTAAVGFWSLASASHALTAGFLTLLAARTALGFGEGATFPGGLRTVVQTLPPHQRARGVAVSFSGGALGALITPLIMTPVFHYFGWRGAFWFTGIIGLSWLAMWQVLCRRPDLRKLPETADTQAPSMPDWKDRRFWSYAIIYACGSAPLGLVLYYAPLYLKVLGKTQLELGSLLWIPPLGWELGYYAWGWVTDRAIAGAGFTTAAYRKLFTLLVVLSLPLAAVPHIANFPVAMALLCFAMFIASGFIIGTISYATSTFGAANSAFLAGIGAGAWSALVALIMPVAGRLFDQHNYSAAFLLAAMAPLAGGVIWTILNREPRPTLVP